MLNKYVENHRELSKERSESLGRRNHKFDPNMEEINNHPLYKNEKQSKNKPKKKRGKLNLIKNKEMEKMKEEMENNKLQLHKVETFGPEENIDYKRELELKVDEINK